MEMKDMIVIKNLPSNIVEEAWVIIKPEVKNKEKELIKRMKNSKINEKIFQIIFALPVEICVRFPYYGSKQR